MQCCWREWTETERKLLKRVVDYIFCEDVCHQISDDVGNARQATVCTGVGSGGAAGAEAPLKLEGRGQRRLN